MGIGKTEFLATEELTMYFEPFIDQTTSGRFIFSGDTCTLIIVRPDNSLLPGGPHVATRNTDTGIWSFSVTVGSYAQGRWLVKAVSDHASAPNEQFRVYFWGVGFAADIASIKVDTTNIAVDAANAAAAAVAADTKATDIQTKVNLIHKLKKNGARIIGNQEIFYDDDGSTPILKFDLFDENSQATSTRIFRRIPVP